MIHSLEDAWAAFLEHATYPLPERRAYEDRICFYAGAIAGIELAQRSMVAVADRDILKFNSDLERNR